MVCASDGVEHEFRNGMRCMPDGSVDYKGAGMSRDEIAALHHNPLVGVLGLNPGWRMSKSRAIRFILALNGMSENKVTARLTRHGEIRVNYSGGDEATAYYTSDPQDAIDTAQAMQRGKENPGSRSALPGSLAYRVAQSETGLSDDVRMRTRTPIATSVHTVAYTHCGDGKSYKHEFGPGVKMFALGNGDILLTHDTKRLWEDFK
jgi:hypothetical protein